MGTMPAQPLLVLCKDLLFSSRITAAAKQAGIPFTFVREPQKLTDQPGARLILDLNLPGAIEAAAAWQQRTNGQTIGFVSHVDSETIAAAKTAGIQVILPRSQFVQKLPEILQL